MKYPFPKFLSYAFFFFSPVLLSHCGNSNPLTFHPLMDQQPYVTEISPSDGSVLRDPVSLKIKFSERIHLEDVHPQSIAFFQIPPDPELRSNQAKLVEEIREQALPQLNLRSVLEGNETVLTLIPESPLEPGIYYLVVTPELKSVHGIPFNQEPGNSPTPFVALFGYGPHFEESVSLDDPQQAPPNFGPDPDSLVLNEILYDGLTSETDGEAFIELWGTPDTEISGYEILLINGANGEETDQILLPEGSWIPSDGLFVVADLKSNSTSESRVENFDYLDHFDPQNGPDAVFLLNRQGEILDRVQYGCGGVATTPKGENLAENLPAEDASAGESISRIEGVDSQDNSKDFVVLSKPSPGIL